MRKLSVFTLLALLCLSLSVPAQARVRGHAPKRPGRPHRKAPHRPRGNRHAPQPDSTPASRPVFLGPPSADVLSASATFFVSVKNAADVTFVWRGHRYTAHEDRGDVWVAATGVPRVGDGGFVLRTLRVDACNDAGCSSLTVI